MSNVGNHKASDRKVLKTLFSTYGSREALALLASVFYLPTASKPQGHLRGARGRSCLGETPCHEARRVILDLQKRAPAQEETPEVTGADTKLAVEMLEAYGPVGILELLGGIFKEGQEAKMVAKGIGRVQAAEEHLAERRRKFNPSPTEVQMGFNPEKTKEYKRNSAA